MHTGEEGNGYNIGPLSGKFSKNLLIKMQLHPKKEPPWKFCPESINPLHKRHSKGWKERKIAHRGGGEGVKGV